MGIVKNLFNSFFFIIIFLFQRTQNFGAYYLLMETGYEVTNCSSLIKIALFFSYVHYLVVSFPRNAHTQENGGRRQQNLITCCRWRPKTISINLYSHQYFQISFYILSIPYFEKVKFGSAPQEPPLLKQLILPNFLYFMNFLSLRESKSIILGFNSFGNLHSYNTPVPSYFDHFPTTFSSFPLFNLIM